MREAIHIKRGSLQQFSKYFSLNRPSLSSRWVHTHTGQNEDNLHIVTIICEVEGRFGQLDPHQRTGSEHDAEHKTGSD